MARIGKFSVLLCALASVWAQAQSLVSIDVRPARLADLQSRHVRVFPSGDLIATSVNAITLIEEGYSVPANPSERLSGLPLWVYGERFDIKAKASSGARDWGQTDNNTRKLAGDVFRQVLADRFRLKMRVEYKTMPVYALVVADGGPKLKHTNVTDCGFDDGPDGCHSFVIGFGHPLNAKAIDMDDLVHYIENWTDLPVINQTRLTGLYTVSTEGWQPMRLPPPPPSSVGGVDFTHLPTIHTILNRLGLELRKQDSAVPIYRVEHIERPSMD